MAQQTRLETMLPYYERWMQRFPDIASLAAADVQEVLASWEGLGYYSRARNLHQAAQLLLKEHEGKLPKDRDALQALPGIGPYTAGAIASLAFGQDEVAVDGNAARVLARLFDIDQPINSSAGTRHTWDLAREHLPKGKAADFNQALMDLGASLCNPRQPRCDDCPLASECKSYALGNQLQRPLRRRTKGIPLREFAAAAIVSNGSVFVQLRPPQGLLGWMWEFPNVRLTDTRLAKRTLSRSLMKELGLTASVDEKLAVLEHSYSHFKARLEVYLCKMTKQKPELGASKDRQWLQVDQLHSVPMGKLDRQIANLLLHEVG